VKAGKPKAQSNACQLVLKYLLLNPENLAKAWRSRLYYYSSGSVFQQVSGDLITWLEEHEDEGKRMLRKVTYIHVYAHKYTYMLMCVHMFIHMFDHMHTYAHKHTYMLIYTHICLYIM